MLKVTILQQVYNNRKWIPAVYDGIAQQDYPNLVVVAQIVSDDGGCEEYIRQHYPNVIIEKPGYNIGFARGHNELFSKYPSDLYQLVNPDLIMSPDYVSLQVAEFLQDHKLGASTGKLLRFDVVQQTKTTNIDTTGVIMYRSGRARDRGQYEVDHGQYDLQTQLIAVSGAGPMYRAKALASLIFNPSSLTGAFEYFDEEFHSYWEDVDLSLRLVWQGWHIRFIPRAVAWHGRTASSSAGGYKKVFAFIRHHRAIPARIRQLNYKNHIFLVVKNSPKFYWQFCLRELVMLAFIVGTLEWTTLTVLPKFFRQLPSMWRKRKAIQSNSKITKQEFEKLLV